MRRLWLSFVLLICVAAAPVRAAEPRSLAVGAGVFNVSKEERSFEAGLEYRMPTSVWKLAVALGLYGNQDSSFWFFGGLRRDFSLGGRWLVTPAFAISLYEEGNGKDLGGLFEFRTALELGYEWPQRSRLALVIYHLSNAGIYDRNPGSNSLILTYSFPLN